MADTANISKITYNLGEYSLLAYIIASVLVLVTSSLLVRDITFPKEHPWKFVFETLAMAFVATFPFMYVIWSRTGKFISKDLIDYIVLIAKFAGFHLLLQFSGVYDVMFRTSGISII